MQKQLILDYFLLSSFKYMNLNQAVDRDLSYLEPIGRLSEDEGEL